MIPKASDWASHRQHPGELDDACVDHVMKRKVAVNDRMQDGYVYDRSEPVGRNFAPGSEPQLTPKQLLRLGVFGGKYIVEARVMTVRLPGPEDAR